MDDDIYPNKNCIKHYVSECVKQNSIMGGNGRNAFLNTNKLRFPSMGGSGLRRNTLMDFVGHIWCFKKEWLYYMFSVPPFTLDTGEDMHLCFSCKLLGNIDSYCCSHPTVNEIGDRLSGQWASDEFSSYKKTPKSLRLGVEKYWQDKGLKFIKTN